MKRPVLLIVATALLALLCSCKGDFYYANSFLRKFERNKSTATEQIYVSLPREVLHTNSSLNTVPGFSLMSVREQDSVIASLTHVLDKLDDSIFLAQFNQAFLFTLSRTRIPIVVVDHPSQLPKADDQHFVINFVQFEAEEFVEPHRSDFRTKKGMYYAYDYDLRHFCTNVWIQLDARDSLGEVYFKNDEVEESFHGAITSIQDGKATLKTDFDRIDVNDAYRLARRLGSYCATLYVEKMLTEYVCRSKGSTQYYFIYNPGYNAIEEILPYDEGVKDSFDKVQ